MADMLRAEVDRIKIPAPAGAKVNAADPVGMSATERHIAREWRSGRLDEIPSSTVSSEPADRPPEPVVAKQRSRLGTIKAAPIHG